MFDLIDDLQASYWDDKGTPPDDFNEIDGIEAYEDLQIINRKMHPVAKEIVYVVSDAAGKTARNIKVNYINNAKVDPLKAVSHFRAIIKQVGKEEDNLFNAEAILLDMDWCVRKS